MIVFSYTFLHLILFAQIFYLNTKFFFLVFIFSIKQKIIPVQVILIDNDIESFLSCYVFFWLLYIFHYIYISSQLIFFYYIANVLQNFHIFIKNFFKNMYI